MVKGEILEKIQSMGHWRVLIRPVEFQQNRIASLSKCQEVIERAKVSLRGWDYPHIEYDTVVRGQDWIASAVDCMGSTEYWRFYQSGQFVHHSVIQEETRRNKRGLEIVDAIFRLTEVVEFAARLAMLGVLGQEAVLDLQLRNVKGRHLLFHDISRRLKRDYVSNLDTIAWGNTFKTIHLLAESSEIALDAVEFVFDRFGLNVDRRIWAEDQSRLLERRLPV